MLSSYIEYKSEGFPKELKDFNHRIRQIQERIMREENMKDREET